MRKLIPLLLALPCCIAPAVAQVTVDLNALDQLPPSPRAMPPQRVTPPRPQVSLPPAAPRPMIAPAPKPQAPAPQPTAAEAPPATAAPAAPVAVAQPPAPVSPPPSAAAKASLASVRIPFAANATELSPEAASSIRGLVEAAPSNEIISYNVLAYATGAADDPSTARRLSLSRALAARSALLGSGVPSSRIFVRALGNQSGDGPPDRVDVSILGGNAPATRP